MSEAGRTPHRPIVTLTSDFGISDHYVAAMKAAVLRHCPDVHLIDVTHQIPRHDLTAGGFAVERAVASFPTGSVHLAVVDPGVGSDRRILVCRVNSQWVVCPDNGLITWTLRRHGEGATQELTWRPQEASTVFHGRDVMAPIAGMLAARKLVNQLAKPITDPVLLDLAPMGEADPYGRVIHIDHFGNATTNVPFELAQRLSVIGVETAATRLTPIYSAYAQVAPGEPLALIGSSDLLEIAVREGSAAEQLELKVGDSIRLLTEAQM